MKTKTENQVIVTNQVKLSGNIGALPVIKEIGNDRKVARFSMAVSESYRNQLGEWVKNTQWHNVVAWGKQAEYVQNQIAKGQKVQISGKISSRSYTDKEGVKRYITEIVAQEISPVNA